MKSGLRAIDFMSHKVVTVTPDMTIKEAAKLMNTHRVGGVPVCNGDNLIGLLTERDIMMRVIALDKKPSTLKVSSVMQTPLKAIGKKFEDLSSLARKMHEHGISKIPIVDKGKLIGLVTNKDIVAHAPDLLETFIERLAASDKGRAGHPAAFGQCEACGSNGHLHFMSGQFICDECN
jgi:CBS domain-containing protein|tara:strand:- start:4467 stop:4997 length:531 start_codon:yes stop_codon:yes gene_type:complete